MDQAQNNYMNIMTFAVISEALAVTILGSLAFAFVKPYASFLLTVLIGILLIISWALYSIRKNKAKLDKQFKALKNNVVSNVPCPDYYVRDGDKDGNTVCKNGYTTPDGLISYKFQTTPKFENSDIEKVNVDAMFNNKTLQDVCDTNLDYESLYGQIPWTGVKPNCQNLGDAEDFEAYLGG